MQTLYTFAQTLPRPHRKRLKSLLKEISQWLEREVAVEGGDYAATARWVAKEVVGELNN